MTLSPRLALLLLAPLLLARPTLAHPPSSGGERHVELALNGHSAQSVRVRPGRPLSLLFDSRLGQGLELAARERFERVDATEDSLMLLPSQSLREGEKLWMRVPFQGSEAPGAAELLLEVVAQEEDTLIRVYRNGRSAESLGTELEEEKKRHQEQKTENARLRAELQSQPKGLLAVAAAMEMDAQGLQVRDLSKRLLLGEESALALGQAAYSYRTKKRMAVKVHFLDSPGAPPFQLESATLWATDGTKLKGLWLVKAESLGVDIIVETELPPAKAKGPWRLELEEIGGTRHITVLGIVFP